MATVKAYIKGHPVLSYYALVFAISWGGILLVIGGPGAIPGTRDEVETLMPFALVTLFAGPSVAGLLLTGLVHGRPGFRDLFTRMTRWRVDVRWYAVALLTAPLLVTAVLLALSLTSLEFLPRLLTASDKTTLLLFGIGWGLVGFCPGPAIASLAFARPESLVFVLAMAAGAWLYHARRGRRAPAPA